MYILAVDDERLVLDSLITELQAVFPNENVHGENKPVKAIEWVRSLREKGETLEYAFLDIQMSAMTGIELARSIKTIYPKIHLFFCTAYNDYAMEAFDLYAKGYLLKPITSEAISNVLDAMVPEWKKQPENIKKDIRVQTFGHFEVFLNEKSVGFERKKSKELLAYLVDRHGASVTTEQIAMILWEDEPYDRRLKNRTTAIVASLRKSLKDAGIEDILVKSWNCLAIDVSKIQCDAYEFEKGDAVAINSFHGEYMINYSWAEFSTGRYVHGNINEMK